MSGTTKKLILDSTTTMMRAAATNLRSSNVPSSIAKSSAALFSAYGGKQASLPDLPYDYNALERTLRFFLHSCLLLKYTFFTIEAESVCFVPR